MASQQNERGLIRTLLNKHKSIWSGEISEIRAPTHWTDLIPDAKKVR